MAHQQYQAPMRSPLFRQLLETPENRTWSGLALILISWGSMGKIADTFRNVFFAPGRLLDGSETLQQELVTFVHY
jgi:hypothetical protein